MLQQLKSNIEKQLEKQIHVKLLQELLITLAKKYQDLKLDQVTNDSNMPKIDNLKEDLSKLFGAIYGNETNSNMKMPIFSVDAVNVMDIFKPIDIKNITNFKFSLENVDFELKVTEKFQTTVTL